MKTFVFHAVFQIPFSELSFRRDCKFLALTIFLSLFFFSVALKAQNFAHPSFRNYSTDDGLASSEVYEILQDQNDFIWIASDNGLSKFDGYEFRNYGVADGLIENVIFMLQLDDSGKLWMQSMSGNLYYMLNDSIHSYKYNSIIESYKNRLDSSKGFIVDSDEERVYIAIHNEGIITIYPDGSTKSSSSNASHQAFIHVYDSGNITINAFCLKAEKWGSESKGIVKNTSTKWLPIVLHSEQNNWEITDIPLINNPVNSYNIFKLEESCFLIQYFGNICLFKNGAIQWYRKFPHKILNARKSKDGTVYLGLHFYNGLYVYDDYEKLKTNTYQHWLKDKSVSFIMEDNAGGLWVATNENGIFYSPSKNIMTYDLETGLSDKKITSVSTKNQNEIFVSLGNGQLWQYNLITNKWNAIPMPNTDHVIKDMLYDAQSKELWVCQDRLYCLKNETWTKTSINLPSKITKAANNNEYWYSNYIGFGNFSDRNNKIENFHYNLGHRSYCIKKDYHNRIWVGLSDGLYEWVNDSLIGQQHLHPVLSLRIEEIALSMDSTLIIATKGGGLLFWKDKIFEQISQDEGLTSNMLECLLVTPKNQIWAGTSNGLNLITGSFGNRHVENITISHGLPSNEINDLDYIQDELWIGTKKGLVRYTHKLPSRLSKPPLINSFFANNNPASINERISLKAFENNVSIGFSSINYSLGNSINYRYRLNNNQWIESTYRIANFSSLNSGSYVFEVQAQDKDGQWSDSTTVNFTISPPWWNTAVTRIGTLILISSIIALIYFFRTNQINQRYQNKLKIKELERAAFQAQMNPHFIFNCLNSIQNSIIHNDKDGAIKYLGKFAELTRAILNASVKGTIPLVEEIKLLTNYLDLENLRFKDRFNYSIDCTQNIDIYNTEIPPLLVQPYVENALKHGIQNKSQEGMIDITFEKKETSIFVTVIDNGTGYEAGVLIPVKTDQHKSFGMTITKNRLDLLSLDNDQNVEVKVLLNDEGETVGTKVTIRIKLHED